MYKPKLSHLDALDVAKYGIITLLYTKGKQAAIISHHNMDEGEASYTQLVHNLRKEKIHESDINPSDEGMKSDSEIYNPFGKGREKLDIAFEELERESLIKKYGLDAERHNQQYVITPKGRSFYESQIAGSYDLRKWSPEDEQSQASVSMSSVEDVLIAVLGGYNPNVRAVLKRLKEIPKLQK